MTIDDIRAALHVAGLDRIADEVIHSAQPAVRIAAEVVDEDTLPLGSSKIGGRPDLPCDTMWSMNGETPLTFLGQFNLADLASYHVERVLPRVGILSFFYDSATQPWGFDPGVCAGWRVLYSEPSASILYRLDWPQDFPMLCQLSPEQPVYSKRMTLVCWGTIPADLGLTDDEFERYVQLVEASTQGSQLLGHLYPLLRWPQLACEVYSSARPDEVRQLRNATKLNARSENWPDDSAKTRAANWRLLLQLDNVSGLPKPQGYEDHDNPVWNLSKICNAWAREGLMSFWIEKTRLAQQDFSNVWLLCGSEF